jgi:hypothetical protein
MRSQRVSTRRKCGVAAPEFCPVSATGPPSLICPRCSPLAAPAIPGSGRFQDVCLEAHRRERNMEISRPRLPTPPRTRRWRNPYSTQIERRVRLESFRARGGLSRLRLNRRVRCGREPAGSCGRHEFFSHPPGRRGSGGCAMAPGSTSLTPACLPDAPAQGQVQ